MASHHSLKPGRSARSFLHHDHHHDNVKSDHNRFLGRTPEDWDFLKKIRHQSFFQDCKTHCEVMDDNTGMPLPKDQLRDPDYGEAFQGHYLRIDFTPIPGVDDDPERLDKVTSFWNFIQSRPQFKELMVLPEPDVQFATSVEPSTSSSESTIPEPKTPNIEGIELLQEPATSFKLQTMARMPAAKYCPYSEATEDYAINDENAKFGATTGKLAPITVPSCTDFFPGHSYYREMKSDAYRLCQVMDDFDRKHPKSMEPPAHPPPLTSAVTQRIHSTIALPSDKPQMVVCDCPKPAFKTCRCWKIGDRGVSTADIWSMK